MSGSRGGIGRIVAMGIALALTLLLLLAGEARAGKYAVAQCGWRVGADADWAETSAGKFRSESYCVPPAGVDPFDGVHLKSLTGGTGATVSGTRYARWRWSAPPGTAITAVRGTWWHALHDGFEQRLGAVGPGGGFTPFAAASASATVPQEFSAGFSTPVSAFEDRLLCARGEDKWCGLDPQSWSSLRALTLTLEDPHAPSAAIGGDLLSPGWRRGTLESIVLGWDVGSGLRFAETTVDGARVGLTEFGCAKALIGGEWRATRLQPCSPEPWASQAVVTTAFADGPHSVLGCVADFAGNAGCTPPQRALIDNNPPAQPRSPVLAGGEGWRRVNDFDLSWANPDQGVASPIAAACWRVTGPAGFDGGVRSATGKGIAALPNLSVPAAGAYTLRLWLRDEAGNEAPASAAEVPLRLDDVAPQVAFVAGPSELGAGPVAAQVEAGVADPLSGAASGRILYRRTESSTWIELPTRSQAGEGAGAARLSAPLPDLAPGTYVFRADATDGAGNQASTTLRADGTRMEVHRAEPPAAAKTRLFARLRPGPGGDGLPGARAEQALTVGFGDAAVLSGRLTTAGGVGLGGRALRVVTRPSRGAPGGAEASAVRTGSRGGFELSLPPGPSRHVAVSFPGGDGLAAARDGLLLRVRSGISLAAVRRRLRTGELLRLRGRVATGGAPLPRRGKLVAVQYREEATGRWRPVLVARSDHEGRFVAHYRFRYVSGRAEIELRASALSEEGWPFAPGASRPITVVVDGDR